MAHAAVEINPDDGSWPLIGWPPNDLSGNYPRHQVNPFNRAKW